MCLLRSYYKPAILLSLAALSCALFTGLTPPSFDPAGFAPLATGGIPAARVDYWWRFGLSSLLLGVLPLAAALAMGYSPASLGLAWAGKAMKSKAFILAMPAALAIGALGGTSPDLASYYPYASDLHELVGAGGLIHLAGHLAAYFIFYYLPWEFFFRGFLLFPFVQALASMRASSGLSEADAAADPAFCMALGFAVFSQTIASTMLHFGHPLTELISAIPAGLAFGWLAYRTKSILPGLILHALVGFGTDTVIVLSRAGML